jgi:hypothetical protein
MPAPTTPRTVAVRTLKTLRLNRPAAKLYYKFVHGFASAGKELPDVVGRCMAKAIDFGTADRGDYFEFGVFKGHTFFQAQRIANELGLHDTRFYGFDSFCGLPEPEGPDAEGDKAFYAGQYACPLDRVVGELSRRGVDWSRTALIPGYFDDTLTDRTRRKYHMHKASVVLIDADLYISSAEAMKFVWPMLMDKSIVIMDDWNAFDADPQRGQRRALSEMLSAESGWQADPWFSYGSYGRVFVMRQTAKPIELTEDGTDAPMAVAA